VIDETELFRRERIKDINSNGATREALEEQYGKVWTTDELSEEFEVRGFLAPYVVVRRRADGTIGSLEFRHQPRFYFNFVPDCSP